MLHCTKDVTHDEAKGDGKRKGREWRGRSGDAAKPVQSTPTRTTGEGDERDFGVGMNACSNGESTVGLWDTGTAGGW